MYTPFPNLEPCIYTQGRKLDFWLGGDIVVSYVRGIPTPSLPPYTSGAHKFC